jgi:hypothetical protein
MRGRDHLFACFILLAINQPVRAACIDPAQLAHSTVSIIRHFDGAERETHPDLIAVSGTGWFLSPSAIVTAEHVSAAMNLSTEDWKPLEVVDGDGNQFIAARIQRLAGAQVERLAVIELQHAVSEARSIAMRKEPLLSEEPVMTIAYPTGRPQLVSGRFVRLEDNGTLTGLALLELYEGNDRLIVDHGASGAPVIDCNGRVAAVVSDVFTQNIHWAHREIRISTAWGMPNVVSVPVQALDQVSQSDFGRLQQSSSAASADAAGEDGSRIDKHLPSNP